MFHLSRIAKSKTKKRQLFYVIGITWHQCLHGKRVVDETNDLQKRFVSWAGVYWYWDTAVSRWKRYTVSETGGQHFFKYGGIIDSPWKSYRSVSRPNGVWAKSTWSKVNYRGLEIWEDAGDYESEIKFRESFRPFAPSVLTDKSGEYFDLDAARPYMLSVAPVRTEMRKEMGSQQQELFGLDKLKVARSTIPAITHVDYSARVQTVTGKTNPVYYNLTAFSTVL